MAAPSILLGLQRLSALGSRPAGGVSALPNALRAVPRARPGQAAFAGEVDVLTTPAPGRVVRLYDRASGALVRETVTTAAGLYEFAGLSDQWQYYIVALDTQPGGFNAVIADGLTPSA